LYAPSGFPLLSPERGQLLLSLHAAGVDISELGRRGATFAYADMPNVRFSKADLSSLDLSHAYLKNVDLSGADLSGANLTGTNLDGANIVGATINGGTYMSDVVLESADRELIGANLAFKLVVGGQIVDARFVVDDVDYDLGKLICDRGFKKNLPNHAVIIENVASKKKGQDSKTRQTAIIIPDIIDRSGNLYEVNNERQSISLKVIRSEHCDDFYPKP
jgi:Pentapeptide repeats (8 copies)